MGDPDLPQQVPDSKNQVPSSTAYAPKEASRFAHLFGKCEEGSAEIRFHHSSPFHPQDCVQISMSARLEAYNWKQDSKNIAIPHFHLHPNPQPELKVRSSQGPHSLIFEDWVVRRRPENIEFQRIPCQKTVVSERVNPSRNLKGDHKRVGCIEM